MADHSIDDHPDPAGELLIRQRGNKANWKQLRVFIRRLASELAGAPFTVAIVSDAAIRRLNREFRQKDYATDVLSFPSGPAGRSRSAKQPPERAARQAGAASLGDIVISAPTAARAAREHGWPLDDELQALALHGVLHLLDYDHESDRGQMARAERLWGRRLGLSRTLIARQYRKARRSPARGSL